MREVAVYTWFMSPIATNPKGYSPLEVARILSRDQHTVYGYIRGGLLKAENVNHDGRRPTYRITPEELQRFIEQHAQTRVTFRGGRPARQDHSSSYAADERGERGAA